jgi:hypothetical protein
MEYSVSGLCAMIEARQRCESSNNTSNIVFIEPAEKFIQFAGSENSRVQAIITTEILLKMYNEFATVATRFQRHVRRSWHWLTRPLERWQRRS